MFSGVCDERVLGTSPGHDVSAWCNEQYADETCCTMVGSEFRQGAGTRKIKQSRVSIKLAFCAPRHYRVAE